MNKPVIFYPAMIVVAILPQNFRSASLLAVAVSCSMFILGSGRLGFSLAKGIGNLNYRLLSKYLPSEKSSLLA